jgi:hypothetical protein
MCIFDFLHVKDPFLISSSVTKKNAEDIRCKHTTEFVYFCGESEELKKQYDNNRATNTQI